MLYTDKITIGGKEYGVAYCYATEVGFASITGKDISTIKWEEGGGQYVVSLIIAAVYAYYDKDQKESPITDREVLYNATKTELVKAFETIWKMALKWNELPPIEAKAAKAEQAAEGDQEGDKSPN